MVPYISEIGSCSLGNICWVVLNIHMLTPCAILVKFSKRHHNLAMWPYKLQCT